MKQPALYALRSKIAGFDFYPWLVMQRMGGADRVAFDTSEPNTRKFTEEEIARRYQSILKPGPALLGMESAEGASGVEYGPYMCTELIRMAKSGQPIPRLKSVLPPGKEKYTVTLRTTRRWPNRNSNDDWLTFADEIGARVIPDYDIEPMGLHERMALYAGAEMNFFVTNGPIILCYLSEYPAMGFDVNNSPPQGVERGGRYAFMLEQHQQIWEDATLPNIRKHFEVWRKSRWT